MQETRKTTLRFTQVLWLLPFLIPFNDFVSLEGCSWNTFHSPSISLDVKGNGFQERTPSLSLYLFQCKSRQFSWGKVINSSWCFLCLTLTRVSSLLISLCLPMQILKIELRGRENKWIAKFKMKTRVLYFLLLKKRASIHAASVKRKCHL